MDEYDVVIIGAGLAGLQCARELARLGQSVLLVDRKNDLAGSIHTTGIFVRRTLEDFDLPDYCLGPPIQHVRLYSPKRRRMELSSPHAEFRVGRMGSLYKHYLDQAIRGGVVWRPGTRYGGQQPNADGMVVHLEQGRLRYLVKTRFIVGADGANSQVARALKLDLNKEWIVGVEDVFENVPLNGPPMLHCFLDPKLAPGYLAWIAHDGETAHVGVGGYPSRFEPVAALEKFQSSISQVVDLSQARKIERRGGRIPVGGMLRRIVNKHGLLIGDSAGAVSPLTAGGLDPCMRLSTFAAEVIHSFLKSGDERVLHSYNGELFRARFASRIWMRRLTASLNHEGLIEMGCAALRLPLLNSLAWHIFFGRGSFPDTKELMVRNELPKELIDSLT